MKYNCKCFYIFYSSTFSIRSTLSILWCTWTLLINHASVRYRPTQSDKCTTFYNYYRNTRNWIMRKGYRKGKCLLFNHFVHLISDTRIISSYRNNRLRIVLLVENAKLFFFTYFSLWITPHQQVRKGTMRTWNWGWKCQPFFFKPISRPEPRFTNR